MKLLRTEPGSESRSFDPARALGSRQAQAVRDRKPLGSQPGSVFLLALWLLLGVLAWTLPGLLPSVEAEPPAGEGVGARTIAYEIQASLDPVTHTVRGRGTLRWRNPTQVSAPDFHLHLYLNAFRDEHSTFLRESLGAHRGAKFDSAHPGSIDVTSFRTAGGQELAGKGAFSACDDANPDDRTVWSVALPEAIAPGAEAVFQLEWTSLLPKAFARTGFGGDYHMVAQWFPKPGVFEQLVEDGAFVGRWNCHQFHGTSEFFADYGSYDVSLTLPKAYENRVGATGQRVAAHTDDAAGTVTYRYQAHDVHDFAWVCDTDFVVVPFKFPERYELPEAERTRVAALLGRPVEGLHLPRVEVTLLLQPEHADQEERHARAVSHALAYMSLWFGAYPYPTLTVVDPDHRASDTGGMEYPTLITAGTDFVVPERGWDPEFVIVHEFGHQFFYGLVGTNEFEHAWMDEGLNTFATAKVLQAAYPPAPPVTWYGAWPLYGEKPLPFTGMLAGLRSALPFLPEALTKELRIPFGKLGVVRTAGEALGLQPPDDLPLLPETPDTGVLAFLREAPFLTLLPILPITVAESERTSVARRPLVDTIVGVKAWEYMDSRSYGVNSYARTAASLRTLEGLAGEGTLLRGLNAYVERYRYGHPEPEQLFAALSQAAQDSPDTRSRTRDMGSWIETLFRTTGAVDYGVAGISIWEPSEKEGSDAEHGATSGGKPGAAPTDGVAARVPESSVLLRRHGEAQLPVEVLVRFDDGSERRLRWELDGRVLATDGGLPPLQPVAPAGQQGRWTRIRFASPAKILSAETDPRHLLAVERDRTNDGLVREPKGPGAALSLSVRLLGWVQQLTSFYGGL